MARQSKRATPARHVALLRGINVGGKNLLPMKDLAAMFVASGCDEVRTYIQSGNVVFSVDDVRVKKVTAQVEKAITSQFGYQIPIVVRSAAELASVVKKNPFPTATEAEKLHVGFLATAPPSERVAMLDKLRSPHDDFEVCAREIYFRFPKGVAGSKLSNAYLDKTLGTTSTLRNWRTVLKLFELVSATLVALALGACGGSTVEDSIPSSSTQPGSASAAPPPSIASVPPRPGPAPTSAFGPVRAMALAHGNLCGLGLDGTVRCVGDWPVAFETAKSTGLRNQTFTSPITVQGLGEVQSMTLTTTHGCAILKDGTVRCWGNTHASANTWSGATAGELTAVPLEGVTDAIELALSPGEGCALKKDHSIVCFGPDLNIGSRKTGDAPAPRARKVEGALHVSGTWKRMCVVTTAGTVSCWGDNRAGEIDGHPAPLDDKVRQVPGITGVEEISVGTYHTCARTKQGEILCWGSNGNGALGDGTVENRTAPVRVVGVSDAIAIGVSQSLSCALTRGHDVYCWGEDANCDLGKGPADGCIERTMNGSTGPSTVRFCPVPRRIDTHVDATHLSVGTTSACVWDDAGHAECWGLDHLGPGLHCEPTAP